EEEQREDEHREGPLGLELDSAEVDRRRLVADVARDVLVEAQVARPLPARSSPPPAAWARCGGPAPPASSCRRPGSSTPDERPPASGEMRDRRAVRRVRLLARDEAVRGELFPDNRAKRARAAAVDDADGLVPRERRGVDERAHRLARLLRAQAANVKLVGGVAR